MGMLRSSGMAEVALLDGGLVKWAEGRPSDTTAPVIPPSRFVANSTLRWCATSGRCSPTGVSVPASRSSMQGRPPLSTAVSRRPGPGGGRGHIPERNVPFDQVTDPAHRQLKGAEELRVCSRTPRSASIARL